MKRRGHKQRIRRGHESVQGSVDADHATVSGGVIRPGSASSATAPRSSLEAATPTEPGHGPTTPTGVVPCTPPFPARSGGGERHGQIHKVKKLSVTIVVNVTPTFDEHAENTPTARSSPTICITIQQGQAGEVKLEGCGWAVTGINVVGEPGC
ncbi:hypothetical protein NCS52_01579400 [Fusarium sp. LHS14.1]|nr:hypothetical protein NCS52_01579400 [Fusarium sp. LHS14.1]